MASPNRSPFDALGARPEPALLSQATRAITCIDSQLAKKLELIRLSDLDRPPGVDAPQWAALKAQKEAKAREEAEKEKLPYKSVVHLNEIHQIYENLLKHEDSGITKTLEVIRSFVEREHVNLESRQEVARLLLEATQSRSDKLDLSGRLLVSLPVSFGKMTMLVSLDLSCNRLKKLPDSLSALVNLEILNLDSNEFASLPDSIGVLSKLKVLKVSCNMFKALPESIRGCSSMVQLIANFNRLDCLPARIGYDFPHLEKLSAHSNKLSFLPISICELKSLSLLDVHFNNLISLPANIGNLTALQVLNVSDNFSDFGGKVPESIGNLVSLIELDLSSNQIRELPDSLGALENIRVLKVDNNPLVIPPIAVVEHSLEAVKKYMAERWRITQTERDETLRFPSSNQKSRQRNPKLKLPTALAMSMRFAWHACTDKENLGTWEALSLPNSPSRPLRKAGTYGTRSSNLTAERGPIARKVVQNVVDLKNCKCSKNQNRMKPKRQLIP
eukprot:c1810_g1_i1 orf=157-1662(-)